MKRDRIRNINKCFLAAITAMMLALVCAGSIFAFPTKGVDDSAAVTLTLTANSNGKAISGLKLTLYKAADMEAESNGHVTFTLTPEFQEYDEDGPKKIDGGLDPNAFDSSNWAAAAKSLESQVISDAANQNGKKFEGGSQTTGADGKATFTGLSQGLYLLTGSYMGSEYATVEVPPAFLTLPQWSNESEEWIYEASASAKPTATPKSETPKKISITVQKIWANDDSATSTRPVSVNVELLDANGNTVGDPQTLSASNGWKFTWTGLNEGKWSVKESIVPTGYAVSYEEQTTAQGKTITVRNTKDGGGVLGESRENTPTSSSGVKGSSRQGDTGAVASANRLPQTGQLWWPVWVLSALAAVFVMIGLILRLSGKKDLKDR